MTPRQTLPDHTESGALLVVRNQRFGSMGFPVVVNSIDLFSRKRSIELTTAVMSVPRRYRCTGRKDLAPREPVIRNHNLPIDVSQPADRRSEYYLRHLQSQTVGALRKAWTALSDLKAQGEEMPSCAHCQEPVSQPCWYCVDCTGEFLSGTAPVITPPNVRPRRGEVHL